MAPSNPIQPDFALQLTASQRRLHAYITSLVVQADLAMEILQETNRVLLEKAHEFDPHAPGSSFMSWALRVAHFEVLAARKRYARTRIHLLDADVIEQLAVDASERDVDLTDKITALASCLRRLSDRQRQLIDARYQQDLPVRAIAEKLGLKPNTATQTLHRARLDLLECIQRRIHPEAGE